MNLGTMRTELLARGLDYLSSARANAFLNDANRELNSQADWPWLETTATGTAPLTISDVKQVLSVIDTTTLTTLQPMDIRLLVASDANFSTTFTPLTAGSPTFWWLDGLTTLRVYPLNTTDTLAVRYLKRAATLSADGDTPVIPTEYHSAIVSVAYAMAMAADESNDKDQSIVRQEVQQASGYMARDFLGRALDGPAWVQVSPGNSDDW